MTVSLAVNILYESYSPHPQFAILDVHWFAIHGNGVKMRLFTVMVCVLLLASSCQGGNGSENANGEANTNPNDPIQWDRDPYAVVFRADIVGGEDEDAFYMKNQVPDCTVYGDNRVVWDAGAFQGESQILWDRVPDQVIRNFIGELTVNYRIYTYDAYADTEAPGASPVVEVLTLAINDTTHRTDGFAEWPNEYYNDVLSLCQALGQAPAIFEPDAAWVSALPVPYSPSAPSVLWNAESSGLDLNELAENEGPTWVTGNNARALWTMIQNATPDLQFNQGENNFYVAVQAPGVTRGAPPPP